MAKVRILRPAPVFCELKPSALPGDKITLPIMVFY